MRRMNGLLETHGFADEHEHGRQHLRNDRTKRFLLYRQPIASETRTTHLSLRLAKKVVMVELAKPHVIGLNHIALEVGNIDEALAFYGRLFRFELRGKSDSMAFIDLGDQFIALQKGRRQSADDGRHFGLVVDDKEAARKALKAAGVTVLDGPFLDFRDPWGNRLEIVGYDNIQFTKAPNVLRGKGLTHLAKNEKAKKELAAKGMTLE
jgi:predicted enzyme related to lactoylglutathione lyase